MKAAPLIAEQIYDAPAEKIWLALTDKNEMKQWYFDVDDFEPEVGFRFHFTGENEGRKFLHICMVTEAVSDKKISYTWQYENYTGTSMVSFELFDEAGKTKLVLTHTGLETFPQDNPDFALANFTAGWNYITGTSLKEYLENN